MLDAHEAKLLGERIKASRLHAGKTILDVANGCNVHYSQVSRAESGKFVRFAGNVQIICKSLGIAEPTRAHVPVEMKTLHERVDALAEGRPKGAAILARLVDVLEELTAPKPS